MVKLTTSKSNPPLGVLVAVELTKKSVAVELQEGQSSSLLLDGGISIGTINSILRYFARADTSAALYGSGTLQRTEIDHWVDFASSRLACTNGFDEAVLYLDKVLAPATYLVGHTVSLADVAVWGTLRASAPFHQKMAENSSVNHVIRYFKHLSALPGFTEVDRKAPKVEIKVKKEPQPGVKKERKEEGKFIELPGAKEGEVVVRFPPEASGFLHIGHAKAALLNQFYQVNFKGKLIMRFDDTNPAKENAEFEKVILEDLKMLGIKPDIFTHTSDSFELIMQLCEKMIKSGRAYVDNTEPEEMKKEREERVESACRSNSVEKNLAMWETMKSVTPEGLKCCVRAKIDMKSDNGCMRDPTIYRCKLEPHVRTGTKYKVYPTYDFACPIVDSIEGVTHALRTTEYHDRDDQFYWFIEALELRKPFIWEYSRLNLQNTVMSKRKLTWFVDEGLVEGWDDPRFPTVRGVLRRGMTVEGLKEFVIAQGSSRSVNMMDWDKIWAFNKKVIDPVVPRYSALLEKDVVPVIVSGAKEEVKQVQKHPKDQAVGMKSVWYSSKVFIDGADAEVVTEGENVTFVNWGNLIIKKIKKNNMGKVECIEADLNLSNTDYKKTQKITWLAESSKVPFTPTVCVHFDHIISKAILAKEDNFKDHINLNSRTDHVMMGDHELVNLKKGDMIQLQRRGYYICDSPYEATSRHSGRPSPCVLFNIPDGHSKEMPTSGSKHKEKDAPSAKEKAQNKKGKAAEKSPQEEKAPSAVGGADPAAINAKIADQGNKVRELKSQKAPKDQIDGAVKVLLALKAEYKAAAGQDWKPGAAPPAAKTAAPAAEKDESKDAAAIHEQIVSQGNRVRDLKGQKAPKDQIDGAVKALLALKADYKAATGLDWKPGTVPPKKEASPAPAAAAGGAHPAAAIHEKIVDQGNKVRDLKSKKAAKNEIDAAVKALLALKADYKAATGQEWKPGTIPPASLPKQDAVDGSLHPADIHKKIVEQGDQVRKLKSEKASKDQVDSAVKALLSLKADYKKATGIDWKPGTVPPEKPKTAAMPAASSSEAEALKAKIDAQGIKVRELKTGGGAKEQVDAEVKVLLDLKAQYKALTGEDLAGGGRKGGKGKEKENKKPEKKAEKKVEKKPEAAAAAGDREVKKVTRLGLEVTKEESLPDWYSQVITKAEMIEYYDVSGCYVFRPWSFAIWEGISQWFDQKIKDIGFENCYFPIFVSKDALEKEKEHIDDFAPEVAWVMKSGNTELAEPIAIRPTSETVMYPSYSKWVQSHRDLPIKLNQWCSVVRWEFKHPQPFLRTREFLWQEGHSAYATYKEAEHEVHHIIDLYEEIYESLLAIPVIKGKKTIKEKFAGGDFTTTVEAYISASGRGIQAATSHHLGQNFSKMFDISFEDPETHERCFAYQNSWAITTRSIGVIIMVHGDNKGLVLPPRIAPAQVVIVPCGITAQLGETERKELVQKCEDLQGKLKDAGVKVRGDYRDNYSPGWKFNHWELKGVPIRIEIGPRDLKQGQFVAVRRDTGEKSTLKLADAVSSISALLEAIHISMFNKAKKDLDDHLSIAYNFEDFCSALDKKNVIMAPFCGAPDCEDKVKKLSARDAVVEEGAPAMGAKGLCIPFKQPAEIKDSDKCVCPDCNCKPIHYTLFGRSY